MHIALIAHDEKKDLMEEFAIAYKHLLTTSVICNWDNWFTNY